MSFIFFLPVWPGYSGIGFAAEVRSGMPGSPWSSAIYLYSIFINGTIFLVCLPALVLMAFIFKAGYDTNWHAFHVTAVLQLLFALTVPYLLFADVPLGNAIGAPIIASALLGFSALLIVAFGLLAFPVIFFLLHRPAYWRRWLKRILASYSAVVALWFLADLMFRLEDKPEGQSVSDFLFPPEFNVVLYGQILEVDGRSSDGASIWLDGCESYARKILQSDDEGIFRVRAQCADSLVISQVRNFSHSLACIRDNGSGQRGAPLARFLVAGQQARYKDSPHWGGFSREKPYRITCNWSRQSREEQAQLSKDSLTSAKLSPESKSIVPVVPATEPKPIVTRAPTPQLRKSLLSLDAHWLATSLIADGRLYTLMLESDIPTQFGFVEGLHPGMLRIRYQRVGEIDPATGSRARGSLTLTAIDDGGIQQLVDPQSDPLPGSEYLKTVASELDGETGRKVMVYYFLADRGRLSGKLEIIHSMDSQNQVLIFKVNASRDIGYSRTGEYRKN